ncbi:MAG: glycerol kinase GlpK [Acidobacteria bacterium]|nr:glycerol kinase GlpK [Acidobacteriota bacterium]
MSAGLILAIDQGTTNTKGLLVDRSGSPVFRTSSPLAIVSTVEGFVEQDPNDLWESVQTVIGVAVQHASLASERIEALAISNQRETAIAWSASTGEPLANAVSWQCGRSTAICRRLAFSADLFRRRTGLPLASLVSAGKWAWLLENCPAVQRAREQSDLHLGTVDSWLISRLTGNGKHLTDLTNASRTGLLNLDKLEWDRDIQPMFSLPKEAMPALKPSASNFGTCETVPGLRGVPILAAIGDSHAAMFGHAHFSPGSVKATYGTGSSLMALTSALEADTTSLARTIAWSAEETTQFALEGNIPMTGSAVQWLGEFLKLSDQSQGVAQLSSSVGDAAGVYFVPAMLGLGAPHWDADARGTISGLCRHHTSAHLARAALDAVAYQIADAFFAMQSAAGMKFSELLADGGATRNSGLMQFQADILGCPVLRSSNEELSAIGAAWLAGLELGWWKSLQDLESIGQNADRFEPRMSEGESQALYDGWKQAIANVLCEKTI